MTLWRRLAVYGKQSSMSAKRSAVHVTRFGAPVILGIAIGVAVALASARLG